FRADQAGEGDRDEVEQQLQPELRARVVAGGGVGRPERLHGLLDLVVQVVRYERGGGPAGDREPEVDGDVVRVELQVVVATGEGEPERLRGVVGDAGDAGEGHAVVVPVFLVLVDVQPGEDPADLVAEVHAEEEVGPDQVGQRESLHGSGSCARGSVGGAGRVGRASRVVCRFTGGNRTIAIDMSI